MNEVTVRRSSRLKFSALIAIAVVPMLAAYAMYFYFPQLIPTGTTNQGQLIVPPLQGTEVNPALIGEEAWVLFQVVENDCDASCSELLYLSRQITTALGKDTSRIDRVVIGTRPMSLALSELITTEHKDVRVILGDHENMVRMRGLLETVTPPSPGLFLMDPNGNIMMFYDMEKAGKPMLKDLKHLLKLSNIG